MKLTLLILNILAAAMIICAMVFYRENKGYAAKGNNGN